MKRTLSIVLMIMLTLAVLPVSAASPEPDFRIVYPSAAESLIAPGRDFYVIGTASAEQLADKRVKVELYREGESEPVRLLEYKSTYAADYGKCVPALDNCYNYDIPAGDIGMPDIVYDTAAAGPESDSNVKISVTGNNFCALILGGANDDGLTPQGELLTAGNYRIVVTLATGESVSKNIVMGDTADKVISRYSPDGHYQRVTDHAPALGLRMYVDPFPGYWSPLDWPEVLYVNGAPIEDDAFMESLSRWRFADGLEYATGRVHIFLYNINATCASETVELAAVQRTQRIDTDLVCYYYDIGEPELATEAGTLKGELVQMDAGDKLEFTRAQTGAGDDNAITLYEPCSDELDTDLADGVTADEGETVSFFGVTAPIQNADGELTPDGKNAYASGNHVSSIRYTFERDGETVLEDTREVGLQRDYAADWQAMSIYEFRHCFTLTDELGAGGYTVTAEAFDACGEAVDGGTESFALTVEGEEAAVPASADVPAPEAAAAQETVCVQSGEALRTGMWIAAGVAAFILVLHALFPMV